jgi:site-specific DNA-adenine methylase
MRIAAKPETLTLSLFDDEASTPIKAGKKKTSGTFVDNMALPIHRWFRYTAGFSASWVNEVIKAEREQGRLNIIDPFAGSGTVLLEAEFERLNAIGIEAHPYVHRIAEAKLLWSHPPEDILEKCRKFLERAKKLKIKSRTYGKLLLGCYPPDVLNKLETLRQTWLRNNDDDITQKFTWFIITSILRISSPVGTAQWQYVLPNKKKSKVVDPYIAFENKLHELVSDMHLMQQKIKNPSKALIFKEDARDIKSIPEKWGDLVITSPPYANNYDYADATRLEMTFWGDIEGWSDLQDNVRKHLIRACTQHVSGFNKYIDETLANPLLNPIKDDLWEVYNKLATVRLNHGGKKNYHFMIAAYFNDLAQVFLSLRNKTNKGAKMCFVIGDSAPYGVYVPVDKWLGEIAIGVGFNDYHFEKLRDRNVKWKNRKHTVPLHEGRLWING